MSSALAMRLNRTFEPVSTFLWRGLGFADRRILADRLSNLGTYNITQLEDQRIISRNFRGQLSDVSEIQPHMLSAALMPRNISPLGINTSGMFSGLRANLEMTGRGIGNVLHYGLGTVAAAGITDGLVNLSAVDGFGILPNGTGLGIGIAAAASAGLKYVADRLPAANRGAQITKWVSRLGLSASALLGSAYMVSLLHASNASISDIFSAAGLPAGVGFVSGMLFTLNSALRANRARVDGSYSGQLEAGERSILRRRMDASTHAVFGSLNFLTFFSLIVAANSINLFSNVASEFGPWGFVPLALPALGFIAKPLILPLFNRFGGIWDFLKKNSPICGLVAGGAAAGIWSLISHDSTMFIAEATFWGAMLTLFSQFHGIFHEINTAKGDQTGLASSARDIIGKMEIERLSGDRLILGVNAAMDNTENSFGTIFNRLVNRSPNFVIVYCNDILMIHKGNDVPRGKQLTTLDDYRMTTTLADWIDARVSEVFGMLDRGVSAAASLQERYQVLANNLERVAAHYDPANPGAGTDCIPAMIQRFMRDNPGIFESNDVSGAYIRACFQELGIRAAEFLTAAQRLRAKAAAGAMSEADFYREFSSIIRPYDIDFNYTIALPRKAVRGDDLKARKVENLASMYPQRALTIYRLTSMEDAAQPYPTEDWVPGTFTRVHNPRFRYDAAAGTMEASKYLWVPTRSLLVGAQNDMVESLSSSDVVSFVDNTPSSQEGFVALGPTTLDIDGNSIDVDRCFWVDTTEASQTEDPSVIGFEMRPTAAQAREAAAWNGIIGQCAPDAADPTRMLLRPGAVYSPSPSEIHIPTISETGEPALVDRAVYTIPLWHYSLMLDRNVATFDQNKLVALVERERELRFGVQLVHAAPTMGRELIVRNPHPDRTVDIDRGVERIDSNLGIRNAAGLEVPWIRERPTLPDPAGYKPGYKAARQIKITMTNGNIAGVSIVYVVNKAIQEIPLARPSEWPLDSDLRILGLPENGDATFDLITFLKEENVPTNTEGDAWWIRIHYKDGSIAYSRGAYDRPAGVFDKPAGRL